MMPTKEQIIQGGTAYEGMRVVSPDGDGRVAKVLNPDVVLVELTSREKIKNPKGEMVYPFSKFDVSELRAIDKPRPVPGSDEELQEKEKAEAEKLANTTVQTPPVDPEKVTEPSTEHDGTAA